MDLEQAVPHHADDPASRQLPNEADALRNAERRRQALKMAIHTITTAYHELNIGKPPTDILPGHEQKVYPFVWS
jgi:hypothetical protein